MKFTVMSVVALGLVLTAAAQTETFIRVKILKNNCNLRAKALVTSEIVGQVSENDVLRARTVGEEWVEVVAPTNVDLWVLGDYVKDGLINCRQKVNVRAGPGINFSVVGQLADGQAVELRGSHTDWVKIAPPAECSVWIARALVSEIPLTEVQPAKLDLAEVAEVKPVSPAAADTTAPSPPAYIAGQSPAGRQSLPASVAGGPPAKLEQAPKPPMAPAEPKVRAPAQPTVFPPPPGLDLVRGQGRWREVEGVLQRKNFFVRAPSDFRLATYDESGKKSETICFVKGNQEQLKALLYRRLVISGREYWVKRQKYPVLVPERILLK